MFKNIRNFNWLFLRGIIRTPLYKNLRFLPYEKQLILSYLVYISYISRIHLVFISYFR